jgi:hypothetical protein
MEGQTSGIASLTANDIRYIQNQYLGYQVGAGGGERFDPIAVTQMVAAEATKVLEKEVTDQDVLVNSRISHNFLS